MFLPFLGISGLFGGGRGRGCIVWTGSRGLSGKNRLTALRHL